MKEFRTYGIAIALRMSKQSQIEKDERIIYPLAEIQGRSGPIMKINSIKSDTN